MSVSITLTHESAMELLESAGRRMANPHILPPKSLAVAYTSLLSAVTTYQIENGIDPIEELKRFKKYEEPSE